MTDDSHLVTVTAGSVVALGSAASDCHASSRRPLDWAAEVRPAEQYCGPPTLHQASLM